MSGLSSNMWILARHPPDVLFGDAGDDFYRDEQKATIEWRQNQKLVLYLKEKEIVFVCNSPDKSKT